MLVQEKLTPRVCAIYAYARLCSRFISLKKEKLISDYSDQKKFESLSEIESSVIKFKIGHVNH